MVFWIPETVIEDTDQLHREDAFSLKLNPFTCDSNEKFIKPNPMKNKPEK